jgi:uncharacterized protein
MNKKIIAQLKKIFKAEPKVKLAYFFGSRARGDAGPQSDYDFAIYLDEKNAKKSFDIKIYLAAKIGSFLKTDKVDMVILNTAESPELKFSIINEGKLIYEKEPFKVLIEPRILNEYFDFHYLLKKYKLTAV